MISPSSLLPHYNLFSKMRRKTLRDLNRSIFRKITWGKVTGGRVPRQATMFIQKKRAAWDKMEALGNAL